jgi:polysaccharide pyruvyl transferase WcaK-like protein
LTSEIRLRRTRAALGRVRPKGVKSYYFRTYNAAPFRHRPLTLLPPDRHRSTPGTAPPPRLVHVANFGANAGDVLLPVMLRDLFTSLVGPIDWRARHAHEVVDGTAVARLNRSSGVIVGGGGLFLADTNPNELSGWQWSCPTEALESITAPLALFAVGYNQFRGQGDLGPVFRRNLETLARRATYIGLRNTGSIEAVRALLPAELHDVVRFQPCMTTLAGLLYPDLVRQPSGEPLIAFNGAFDRPALRFGKHRDEILGEVARAASRLARRAAIAVYLHQDADAQLVPYFEAAGVPHTVVMLGRRPPAEIVRAWSAATVAVGMRGHAQMIPFGCGRPVVSLASHDKLWYFLDDIGAREWGVELRSGDVADRIEAAVTSHLDDLSSSEARVVAARRRLYEISVANVRDLHERWL